jgi:hypothetical protein
MTNKRGGSINDIRISRSGRLQGAKQPQPPAQRQNASRPVELESNLQKGQHPRAPATDNNPVTSGRSKTW